MNESSSSQVSDTAPLWERLAGVLPLDDAPRAFVGELPSGASALLALALARRHGAALAVLPTPHHLDAFLADCETLVANESPKSEVQSLNLLCWT